MSYKTIFSGSAGPFSGILRPRVAELVTLRFFAKRLFRVARGSAFILSASVSRGLWSGLFFCRLPCRATCASAFILSASVSRGLWSGLYPIGFRVARLVARPLFCRLSCRATCGPAFMSLGCCHRRCHRLRYRRPRRALYRRSRPMDLQSHSYPANRPEIATP